MKVGFQVGQTLNMFPRSVMSLAWRERDTEQRIATAKRALEINPDCAPALILLAEEDCQTLSEAEELLR